MLEKNRRSCDAHLVSGSEIYSDLKREKKSFGITCILILLWTVFRILSWKQTCEVFWKRDFSVADGYVIMDSIVVKGEVLLPLTLYFISKILNGESSQLMVRRGSRCKIFAAGIMKSGMFSVLFAEIGVFGAGMTSYMVCESACNWNQEDSLFQMETGNVMSGKPPGIAWIIFAFFIATALTYFWWGVLLCALRTYISNKLVCYGACIGILILRIGLRDWIGIWGIQYSQWLGFDIGQAIKIFAGIAVMILAGLNGIKRKNFI